MTTNRVLPMNVIARWDAADWNDDTMTASAYTYEDIGKFTQQEIADAVGVSHVTIYYWAKKEQGKK